MTTPLSPDLLSRVGTALYGPDWRASLARALDLNERTIRRWVNDEYPIPASARADLAALVHAEAPRLAADLRRRLAELSAIICDLSTS